MSVMPETGQVSYEKNNQQVKLNGVLDFTSVSRLLRESRDWFTQDLVIDFSDIRNSNSAGLALLLEWMKISRQNGRQIKYHNVPAQLMTIAHAYGIDAQIPVET